MFLDYLAPISGTHLSWFRPFQNWNAGMVAGVCTTAIMAPGERIKCLLQVRFLATVYREKANWNIDTVSMHQIFSCVDKIHYPKCHSLLLQCLVETFDFLLIFFSPMLCSAVQCCALSYPQMHCIVQPCFPTCTVLSFSVLSCPVPLILVLVFSALPFVSKTIEPDVCHSSIDSGSL